MLHAYLLLHLCIPSHICSDLYCNRGELILGPFFGGQIVDYKSKKLDKSSQVLKDLIEKKKTELEKLDQKHTDAKTIYSKNGLPICPAPKNNRTHTARTRRSTTRRFF